MHKCISRTMVALSICAAILLSATPALAESGTLADCLSGCKPNQSLCIDCCSQVFSTQAESACLDAFSQCNGMCESLTGIKALMCYRQCQDQVRACIDPAPRTADFNCPGWVKPQDCPECQTWSPRRQQCVGAPKELCDPQ